MPTVNKIQRPWIKKAETQNEKKTDPFYNSTSWRKLRTYHLGKNPLCYYSELKGLSVMASVVDHFRPRKLFPELELDHNNLRSASDYMHNVKRQWERNIKSREQFERDIDNFIKSISK